MTKHAPILIDAINNRSMLVTGANGFVGLATCRAALADGWLVRGTCRGNAAIPTGVSRHVLDLAEDPELWRSVMVGVDVVVHTAARVHVMGEVGSSGEEAFSAVNVAGTIKVAEQAAKAGVRRFIYISTVKVNGESTSGGMRFTAEDVPEPRDSYAVSKHQAEQALQALAKTAPMEIVIIRPPLVYGHGVKANFAEMIAWMRSGIPLPFGAIRNKRSLIALDALVDFILTCARHPDAANQIFLVSDGNDLSTTELMVNMAKAMNIPARLIPIPEKILIAIATICGKGDLAQRLCGSLQVDISKNKLLLNWVPPVSAKDGFRRVVENDFQKND